MKPDIWDDSRGLRITNKAKIAFFNGVAANLKNKHDRLGRD